MQIINKELQLPCIARLSVCVRESGAENNKTFRPKLRADMRNSILCRNQDCRLKSAKSPPIYKVMCEYFHESGKHFQKYFRKKTENFMRKLN